MENILNKLLFFNKKRNEYQAYVLQMHKPGEPGYEPNKKAYALSHPVSLNKLKNYRNIKIFNRINPAEIKQGTAIDCESEYITAFVVDIDTKQEMSKVIEKAAKYNLVPNLIVGKSNCDSFHVFFILDKPFYITSHHKFSEAKRDLYDVIRYKLTVALGGDIAYTHAWAKNPFYKDLFKCKILNEKPFTIDELKELTLKIPFKITDTYCIQEKEQFTLRKNIKKQRKELKTNFENEIKKGRHQNIFVKLTQLSKDQKYLLGYDALYIVAQNINKVLEISNDYDYTEPLKDDEVEYITTKVYEYGLRMRKVYQKDTDYKPLKDPVNKTMHYGQIVSKIIYAQNNITKHRLFVKFLLDNKLDYLANPFGQIPPDEKRNRTQIYAWIAENFKYRNSKTGVLEQVFSVTNVPRKIRELKYVLRIDETTLQEDTYLETDSVKNFQETLRKYSEMAKLVRVPYGTYDEVEVINDDKGSVKSIVQKKSRAISFINNLAKKVNYNKIFLIQEIFKLCNFNLKSLFIHVSYMDYLIYHRNKKSQIPEAHEVVEEVYDELASNYERVDIMNDEIIPPSKSTIDAYMFCFG